MLVDEGAVEAEDVTGDHGREDAIELRDTLLLYGVLVADAKGE